MALKADPSDQALLLELQALDTKLQQLGHRAATLPELVTLTTLAAERESLQRTVVEQAGASEDAQAELKRTESDVAVVEARIARDSERLQSSASVKDVAALEQELAALAKRKNDLEDIELAVMETAEERDGALATSRAALDDLDGRIAEVDGGAGCGDGRPERRAGAGGHGARRDRRQGAGRPARAVREAACPVRRRSLAAAGRRLARQRRRAQFVRHEHDPCRRSGRRAALPGFERDPGAHRGVRPVSAGPSRELIVEADGGSRGNPGVAAGGSLVIDSATGEVLAEMGVYCGIATNNVAEYNGMIAGIRRAIAIDPHAVLHVRLDSKLVVEQMSGRWKIKHPGMAELAAQAREILTGTPVSFEWIPRAENSRADAPRQRVHGQEAVFRAVAVP